MDRNLLVKGAAIVIGVIILILLAIWIFSGHGSGEDRARTTAPSLANRPVWKKPVPGEPFFTLLAIDRVAVTVTYFDGTAFFQDTIPAGESRDIPKPGKPITIKTDHPENLRLRVKDTVWPMQDSTTKALLYEAVLDRAPTH